MFEIDNKEIGTFISGLIKRKFKSARRFCIKYLKTRGEEKPTEESIQNMANRLSQIKKGTKAIQIYDLPIFSELLDVSFEQILSAGKCNTPKDSRMTNYTIALSHNKKEWTTYIEREDAPILNPDEYGKTVLDYAIESSNYNFLKFLMDENYIWFDSHNDSDYIMTFGAGTNIQRIKFEDRGNGVFVRKPEMDDFQHKLATEDQLRLYIIALAADHNDLEALKKMRARELPELYYRAHYLSAQHPDFNAHYDKNMVIHIAKSSDKILDYFTSPFEIRDHIRYKDGSKRKHTFIFPYISQLLNMLIENNSPFLETALKKAIAHSETTQGKLRTLIEQATQSEYYFKGSLERDIEFFENGNIIIFRNPFASAGIITNIAHVTKKSKDTEVNKLIEQLNNIYNRIRNIKTEEVI